MQDSITPLCKAIPSLVTNKVEAMLLSEAELWGNWG